MILLTHNQIILVGRLEGEQDAGRKTTSDGDSTDIVEPQGSEPVENIESAPESVETASAAEEPSIQEDAPSETEASETESSRTDAGDQDAPTEAAEPADAAESAPAETAPEDSGDATETKRPRKSRRKRKSKTEKERAEASSDTEGDGDEDSEDASPDQPEQVGAEDTLEEAARARTRLRRRYKIQDVIKVRQILLVQVVKEERGNKGAALTTYLSLAGRYCVLMPNTARGGGISRKITNATDRKRLREITGGLEVPQGMGLIVRTAGAERTKPEIKRDYEFLLRQWEQIRDLTLSSIAPTLIYEEGSLIKRSIRDIYSKEIEQIQVEGDIGYREAKEYMKMLMPSHAKNVQPYTDPIPLFSRYQVESYLNGMFNPVVQLKSGGYIVIGITEALVAVDVNSGRATKQGSIEETALQTNLEAADEVARQLRLRDLAGLIVIDFIDMDENRNNRAVEKRMKDRLKTDRARIQVGRISAFGLMEMSRQRLRPGMLEATTQTCPTCQGMGYIRSDENLALSILRELEEEGVRGRANQVVLKVPVAIANYLINQKRESVAQIEERHGLSVAIMADPLINSPDFEIERSKSQTPRTPKKTAVVTAESVADDDIVVEEADAAAPEEDDSKSRRRRGKRGGRRKRGQDGDNNTDVEARDGQEDASPDSDDTEDKPKSRRNRGRRRGGRGRKGNQENESAQENTEAGSEGANDVPVETAPEAAESKTAAETAEVDQSVAETAPDTDNDAEAPAAEDPSPAEAPAAEAPDSEEAPVVEMQAEPEPEPAVEEAPASEPAPQPDEPKKPRRRGWWSMGR
ncbi:MAG: Rne/Rng family ribonuclease [Pseudomonadota bacterium]